MEQGREVREHAIGFRSFESIPVWQDSRKMVTTFYKVIASSAKLRNDFVLVGQLKRSAYSIMLNIAEGFERGSIKEFANFLSIAKGSAGELRSITYIMLDTGCIDFVTFEALNSELKNISKQLSGYRSFLIKKSA